MPDKKLRFDYDSRWGFATLCATLPFGPIFCKMTEASAAWQTGANWRKLKHFDAVLEVRNAYKGFIHLPRQDLMPKQRMVEISHLWAEWYLIYTPFTPFEGELPD